MKCDATIIVFNLAVCLCNFNLSVFLCLCPSFTLALLSLSLSLSSLVSGLTGCALRTRCISRDSLCALFLPYLCPLCPVSRLLSSVSRLRSPVSCLLSLLASSLCVPSASTLLSVFLSLYPSGSISLYSYFSPSLYPSPSVHRSVSF